MMRYQGLEYRSRISNADRHAGDEVPKSAYRKSRSPARITRGIVTGSGDANPLNTTSPEPRWSRRDTTVSEGSLEQPRVAHQRDNSR